MKKKVLLSVISIIVLLSALAFPVSAAVSNLDDTVVADRVYYSSSSDYLSVKSLVGQNYSPGDTVENNGSFLSVSMLPNYFYEQFNVYSSSGLPIADSGHTYSFTLSNFYSYIDSPHGVDYLSSVDRISVALYYTDGTNTEYQDLEDAKFVYSSDTNTSYIEFNISPTRPVSKFHLRYYYKISNFGLSFVTSSTDLSDYIYYIGTRSFKIEREEVYPSADSGALDDQEAAEKELIDATSGGMAEFNSLTNNLQQYFAPNTAIYRGVAFFGNFMADIVGTIPDFNILILVSLSIGIIMVVLGSVLFSMGSGKSNSVKNDKGKKGG